MRGPTEAQTGRAGNGFLVFPALRGSNSCSACQGAFDTGPRLQAGLAPPLDAVTSGPYYDIPDPLDKDESFIDIVDHPSYFGCLKEFTGGSRCLRRTGGARCALALHYTSWRRRRCPQQQPVHHQGADLRQRRRPGRGASSPSCRSSHKRSGGAVTPAAAARRHSGHTDLHRRGAAPRVSRSRAPAGQPPWTTTAARRASRSSSSTSSVPPGASMRAPSPP